MVKRLKVEIYTSNAFGNEVKLADLNLLNVRKFLDFRLIAHRPPPPSLGITCYDKADWSTYSHR